MKPTKPLLLLALVLSHAACGGGDGAAPDPGPAPDAFTLTLEHHEVPIGQGAMTSLGVTVTRAQGFTGAVELEVTGLPAGVTVLPATIAADRTTADLALVAAGDAPQSLPTPVTVRGTSGADSATRSALVTVLGGPGDLDETFGGPAATPIGIGEDFAEAVAVQADGKIVVVGATTGVGGTDVAVVRYLRDGGLDEGFGVGGKVVTTAGTGDSQALAVALQPDGKIVVAGFANGGATGTDFLVLRYLADGRPDAAFDGDGQVLVPFGAGVDKARAVAVQPDGKLVVAGDAAGATTGQDLALARLGATGALDGGFGEGGKVTTPVKSGTGTDIAYAVALVTVSGETRAVVAGGEGDFVVARYTAAGALDGSFAGDGLVSGVFGSTIGSAYAIAASPDGGVVAAGHVGHAFALFRLDANGAPVDGFGDEGTVITPVGTSWNEATAVALQEDGKVVAAGWADPPVGTASDFAVVRLTELGVRDGGFGDGGQVVTPVAGAKDDVAHALALQPDERVPTTRIVLAGSANDSNNDFAVRRYWP